MSTPFSRNAVEQVMTCGLTRPIPHTVRLMNNGVV